MAQQPSDLMDNNQVSPEWPDKARCPQFISVEILNVPIKYRNKYILKANMPKIIRPDNKDCISYQLSSRRRKQQYHSKIWRSVTEVRVFQVRQKPCGSRRIFLVHTLATAAQRVIFPVLSLTCLIQRFIMSSTKRWIFAAQRLTWKPQN